MNEKNTVPAWLSVVVVITVLASIILYAYDLFTAEQSADAGFLSIVYFVAALFALVYCVYGANKNERLNFRIACILYALYSFATIVCLCGDGNRVVVGTAAAALAASTVLAVSENLGKTKSLIHAFILVIAAVVALIAMAGKGAILSYIAAVLFALSYVFMVLAKYVDKKARGSK